MFRMWEAMAAQGGKPSLGYMKACLKAKEGLGRRKAVREGERLEGKRKGKTGWISNCLQSKVPSRALLGLWVPAANQEAHLP